MEEKAKKTNSEKTSDNGSIGIIKTGGKQYKVKAGDTIKIEKLPQEVGEKVVFDDLLGNAKVSAEVLEHGKSPKVMVMKFHSKKRYERNHGHRQDFTKIKIETIK